MDYKMLLDIVTTSIKIGMFSFGGGYAAIPIVEKQIVEVNKWMTYAEFSDVLAIDELTPGPVAINCATFVGSRMAGTIGGIAATFGSVLPSIIIALILVKIYFKYHGITWLDGILGGLRCMVLGLLASTAISLFINAVLPNMSFDIIAFILFLIGLFVLRKFKVDPIFVIIGSGVISLLLSFIL